MNETKDARLPELVIRGATIVDGSGAAAFEADVVVEGDRIRSIGAYSGQASREIDARGLMLAPGFIDPHTHYDAQLFWDPLATPSSLHGVTTVIGGNCGFTFAPLIERDTDYLCRMMSNVEGMSLEAIRSALPWNWTSFGDYLDRLEGRIAVNAGFLVGHCAIRRAVMGVRAIGEQATESERVAMVEMLRTSLDEGGLGLSTSRAFTHADGDGEPVASRWASEEEVVELCEEVSRHAGTTLEFIMDGCLNGFTDEEIDLAARMSVAADRPANWNVLTVTAKNEDMVRRQLDACARAAEKGGRVVALTMPVLVDLCLNFREHCALHSLPGWKEILSGSIDEQCERLKDPEIRRRMNAGAKSPEAGALRGVTDWKRFRIGHTESPDLADLEGRLVGDIAQERALEPFDALLDIVVEDRLATILWPQPSGDDDPSWALRSEVWDDPNVMLGGSDAGAHLDRMCGAPYPTLFLADVLRGRRLVSIERAIEMLCAEPAALFGLRDRGRIAEGFFADLVLFDPDTVDATPARASHDLPDGSLRLVSDPIGVRVVIVNGEVVVEDGKTNATASGHVLRSGRDTQTVSIGFQLRDERGGTEA